MPRHRKGQHTRLEDLTESMTLTVCQLLVIMGVTTLSMIISFHDFSIGHTGGGGVQLSCRSTWRVHDLSANNINFTFLNALSVSFSNSDWLYHVSDTFTTTMSDQCHKRIPEINYQSLGHLQKMPFWRFARSISLAIIKAQH